MTDFVLVIVTATGMVVPGALVSPSQGQAAPVVAAVSAAAPAQAIPRRVYGNAAECEGAAAALPAPAGARLVCLPCDTLAQPEATPF